MKINTIIFDFGDVFINLDKHGAMNNALKLFKLESFSGDLMSINMQYEQGLITSGEFIEFYSERFPYLSQNEIITAWNYILRDFPEERFKFLEDLRNNFDLKLFLLSNTNEIHIDWVKETVPFYEDFKACFDEFYLSHEIQLRKPDHEIYQFVLEENNLDPNRCLFIDDTKENTDAALELGLHVWNIDETSEDVRDLLETKSELF